MILKDEKLNDIVKDGYVLVDFFATWCGPCKMQGAVLEKIEDKLKIVKVDVDEREDLAREYGVMSIPTLVLFKDGEIAKKNVGFTPAEVILSWIGE